MVERPVDNQLSASRFKVARKLRLCADQASAEHLGLVAGKGPGKAAGDFLATG
jgi:hypothetical protein